MASLHKERRSRYWRCVYTDADGKRVFRSTKQTNKTAAWRVAIALEDAAKSARHGHITGLQLRKVITETVSKVSDDIPVLHTIADWFNAWKADMEMAKAKGTGVRYAGLADDFMDYLGDRAKKDLATLTKIHVQNFRDSLVKKGLSNSSADIALKTIRTCLELAVSQGYITHNPARAVTLLGRDESIKRAFTNEEIRRLLTAAPDQEWRGVIRVGYYVGGRLQNCARLRWNEVNLAKGLIRYTPVKQKKGKPLKELWVPIHPDLQADLKKQPCSDEFVFPKLARMEVSGLTGLSLTFRKIIDAAGIKYIGKKPRGKAGRIVYTVGFHSLRRSFNSSLANAGVSQELRQRLIGHASEEVNDGYTELDVETYRDAIHKLPSLEDRISPSTPKE